MLIHILINFTKEDAKNIKIDYIRLLGFSPKGQKYLNIIKKDINIPIITHYKKNFSKLLDLEIKASQIYHLITDQDLIQKEFKNKPIREKIKN